MGAVGRAGWGPRDSEDEGRGNERRRGRAAGQFADYSRLERTCFCKEDSAGGEGWHTYFLGSRVFSKTVSESVYLTARCQCPGPVGHSVPKVEAGNVIHFPSSSTRKCLISHFVASYLQARNQYSWSIKSHEGALLLFSFIGENHN